MSNLITITPTTKKMSSLDIAELTEKQHKNVLRDIRNLTEQGAITALNFEPRDYKDDRGKTYPMYLLDFQATMVLITGYDAKKRAVIIARWLQFERGELIPEGKMLVDKDHFKIMLKNAELQDKNAGLLERLLENEVNTPRIRHNWTPDEDARMFELLKRGFTQHKAGLELGRTAKAICGRLRTLKETS